MIDHANRLQALRQAATERYRNGDFDAAEQLIGEALKLDPKSPELWSNRGTALALLGQRQGALDCFNQALTLRPDFLGALVHRAHILFELQRYDEAAPDYERLSAADAGLPYALGNLVFCKLQCCDWRDLDHWRGRVARALRWGKRVVPPVLSLAFLESPADQLLAAQIVARDRIPPAPALWTGERYRHERIRLAYVSADFHAHASAMLTAGLFEQHDRTRFELIAISFGPDDGSAMRGRLKQAFEHFIDMRGKSDADIARLMREREVDIAVDLKGYTSDARPSVFAQRPAPLQVSFLGYPGTLGAPFMDYLIADRIVVPEDHGAFYSEQIVRLPDTYQPNDASREIADRAPGRTSAGLPERGFVFCCFNNSYKIQPPVFDVWMRLLRAIPDSVLWLLADSATAERNLRHEAAARNVDPARLIFAARCGLPEHLARHRLADLFLDTLPYNAHTTASDALWTGLPVVTCKGNSFAGRVAASLLHAAGLPELVTDSLDAYEALALRLARDPASLAAIETALMAHRETLRLFDIRRFARHLEAAYAVMYERHHKGLPPEGFSVAPHAGTGGGR